MVPLTPQGEIVMVRQWRHGARTVTLEIPGGIVDPGETALRAAERELLEETGYRAEQLEHIGVVNPNPALFGNRVDTFLARGARRVAEVANEGHEETSVELVPAGEVPARLRSGEIDHALVIAALHWFSLAAAGSGGGDVPCVRLAAARDVASTRACFSDTDRRRAQEPMRPAPKARNEEKAGSGSWIRVFPPWVRSHTRG